MTACSRLERWLDDYVDGTLPGDLSAEVAAHLPGCPSCAQEVSALRTLLARASGLPDALEPARDLWPGIEGRIRPGRPEVPAVQALRGSVPARWALAAAAACLLLGFTSALLLLRPGAGSFRPVRPAAPPSAEWAAVKASEPDYSRARAQLLAALRAREGQLSPHTREIVYENLAIMDKSLRDMKAALEKDPGNRGLAVLIEETYRLEIDLLLRVTQSTEKI